ncbi:MAG TPA: spondin domain-containing protein [Verrucomicrobiae bacterium]|nr:spondin domain-containing protein [Verrucomicrobiae bacterium]
MNTYFTDHRLARNLAILAAAAIAVALRADITPPVVVSAVAAESGIKLSWTGGRPNYQVQIRGRLDQDWLNLDTPTATNTVTLPITAGQAYFRVVSDFTAQYRVDFHATWSQATLPTNWPAGAHFSGLVGGVHNAEVHFWRDGETASEGIRLMAERGQKATLLNEIAPAIANGTAIFQLSGDGVGSSPGTASLVFPQAMRRDYPLVTLVSMIAPSPDWFVGVDSLSLIEDGQWVASKEVTLYGRDAGTDSGITFTSPDQVTAPRGVVEPFTGFPALQDGVIVPFGTFTFTRVD